MVEAPLPRLAHRSGHVTRHTASYLMGFTHPPAVAFGQTPVLTVAQCAVTMIVCGPSLVAAYAPGHTRHVRRLTLTR